MHGRVQPIPRVSVENLVSPTPKIYVEGHVLRVPKIEVEGRVLRVDRGRLLAIPNVGHPVLSVAASTEMQTRKT